MKQLYEILSGRDEILLDIGCGPNKRSQKHIGIDQVYLPAVDIVANLEEANLPFKTNTVDGIVASHVLEHIHNFYGLMEELWRVMKPRA